MSSLHKIYKLCMGNWALFCSVVWSLNYVNRVTYNEGTKGVPYSVLMKPTCTVMRVDLIRSSDIKGCTFNEYMFWTKGFMDVLTIKRWKHHKCISALTGLDSKILLVFVIHFSSITSSLSYKSTLVAFQDKYGNWEK